MSSLPFLDDPKELERYSSMIHSWIAEVLGDQCKGSLQDYLLDGSVLCRLANKMRPGSVKQFHSKAAAKAMQLENIGYFFSCLLNV